MKAMIVLVWAGSLALTGCMNTYDLTRDIPEMPRDKVNARLLGKVWTIERLDGLSSKGTVRVASVDSITYVEEYSGQAYTVPTRSLATISCSPSAAGPILGFLGGAAMGFAIGASAGASAPRSDNLAGVLIEQPMNTISGAAVGVLIGVPLGLIIGSELSAGSEYVFNRRGMDGNIIQDRTLIIDRKDFISQTDTSVTFLWEGKVGIVSKSVAMIYPQGDQVRIVLPRSYIHR